MREFAQVMPTFWTGETGKAIKGKPELQVLAFYLITSPHANALGLYYLPIPFITHETGLTEKKVRAGFKALSDFCRYDADSEFVWVVGMAGFQLGNMTAKDNRMKGLLRAWQGLPSNPFTLDFWTKYGERYGFERRASKGLSKGPEGLHSDTETEIETDTDLSAPENGAGSDGASPKALTSIQEVVRGWKIQSGNQPDDAVWDKTHFAANAAHAKKLLALFNGDVGACLDCIEDRWNQIVGKQGLNLSLAGVVKNSDVFRQRWLEQKERQATGVR